MADVTPIDFTNTADMRAWYQSQLNILGATSKYILLQCGFEHLPLAFKTQQLMHDMLRLLAELPADDLDAINAQKLDT